MKNLIILGLLFLTACNLTTEQKQAIKEDAFFIACTSIPTANALFETYVSSGKVKQDIIDKKNIAILAAQKACDGPLPTNIRSATLYVQGLMTTVVTAIAQAKKQAGA